MARISIASKGIAAVAAGLATMAAVTQAFASQPSQTPSYWHPWFEIGGYHNSRDEDRTGTTGTNRGETTIFAPIRGNARSLLFGQITAKFFDDTAKEGNFALGYRKMMPWGFNLGASIGGDVRRTDIDNTFWQLSGGFEALSKNVDFRFNWYGPVTAPQAGVAGFAQVHLQGNQIFITGGEEVALKGVDGEIGFRVPTEHLSINPDLFELRAYAGGFHFYSDDALDNVTGVKGRLELRVNDVIPSLPGSRLTVDYEVSHDDVRDTRHDIGLRMRIPLNGDKPARSLASLSHQQRRMLDGIERDTDIITVRSKRENVKDALTGTDFDRVAYATTEVTTTSNTAGDNSLIILNGEAQGAQTLQGNQTLQGGGSTISVRGRRSGLVLPFTAPGAAGSVTTPVNDERNLTLAGSNTHVSGLTIVGRGQGVGSGDGVYIRSNKTNMFLTNLDISQTGRDGVFIYEYNDVHVLGSTIADTGRHGIYMQNFNDVVISGVTIKDPDAYGIESYSNKSVLIDNTTILGAQIGIRIGAAGSLVRVRNTTIHDTSGSGVHIERKNDLIEFDNVTISNAGLHGIQEFGGENTIVVANSTISDTTEDGIYLQSHSTSDLTVLNSSFSNIGENAIAIFATNANLRVANTTFAGSLGGYLFRFEGGASDTYALHPDSTGNVDNTTGGQGTCQRTGASTITGEITFVDGTTLVNDANCP